MGPKKQSQAEKDAIAAAAAEEERLAIENEVKRIEDLRLKREEELRQRLAAQIAFRQAEIEQLKKEAEVGKVRELETLKLLQEDDAKEAAALEWKQHLECSALPNAANESDVNTYISINAENMSDDFNQALDQCAVTENISNEVRKVMAQYESVGDEKETMKYFDLCKRLRETTRAKIDKATLYMIQQVDEFIAGSNNNNNNHTHAGGGGGAAAIDNSQVLITHSRNNMEIKVGIWANLITKSFRGPSKFIQFKDIGLQVDVPKQLNQLKIAVRISHLPYSSADDVYDNIGQNTLDFVIGGLVNVDIIFLPSPPKQIKPQWMIRPNTVMSSNALQFLHFGEDHGVGAILAPLKIHVNVPENVYLIAPTNSNNPNPNANLKVVIWDRLKKQWTTDGVHQDTLDYHPDTRSLRFLTQKSGLFALVSSRTMLFPYQHWSLEPALKESLDDEDIDVDQDEDSCVHYTLRTHFVTVKIQIIGSICQLLEPKIKGLYMKALPPGELLFALRDAGINLIPLDHDAANIKPCIIKDKSRPSTEAEGGQEEEEEDDDDIRVVMIKSRKLESKVYREMSSVAVGFDIAASRWNSKVSKLRSVFQVRETSVFTGGNEETEDYGMVLIEDDEASQSYIEAPDVGPITEPGMKCSLIQQKEEKMIPVIPSSTNDEGDGGEEKQAEDGSIQVKNEGEEEDVNNNEGEGGAVEGGSEEETKPSSSLSSASKKKKKKKKAPPEVFNEHRLKGTTTHLYLVNALKDGHSSEEAMERVSQAPPQVCRTLERLLMMTRPVSFS